MARNHAGFILILLFLLNSSLPAMAQPTLPDIAAAADKGVVVLSWNCQYDRIKAIAVYRSADSVNGYKQIGNVKDLSKGLQAFVDGHPEAGKNFYRLAIVFRSGLTWNSNHCGVFVNESLLESSVKLPSNDSLQHFKLTEEKSVRKEYPKTPPESETANVTPPADTRRKISVSFEQAPVQPELSLPVKDTTKTVAPPRKIVISFGDGDADPSVIIRSKYIFTDEVTGHVNMFLPDDVNKHNYSVKFYDQRNKQVTEIPKIKVSKTIIDRRNFQHKGVYKFVLRKDFTELETGFITLKAITPSN